MPTTNSFWDHPIQTIEEALHLRKQIETLQSKLGSLLSGDSAQLPPITTTSARKRSAATIAKMRASQQARWAAKNATGHAGGLASGKSGADVIPNKSKGPKKRGALTPEGRAKLAAAMKARWAARKAGAPAPNVPAA